MRVVGRDKRRKADRIGGQKISQPFSGNDTTSRVPQQEQN